jgi:hypothetical protein
MKAKQTGILWFQVQVLVGPPEKQTLIRNSGGLLSLEENHQLSGLMGILVVLQTNTRVLNASYKVAFNLYCLSSEWMG